MPDGMATAAAPADDPRVPVLREMLQNWAALARAGVGGWGDVTVRALLAQLDAADDLRGPIEELKDKHPVVLYFPTKDDAQHFADAIAGCFDRPVLVRL